MRTANQLDDISDRSKTGYVVTQQSLTAIREEEMLVGKKNIFDKLFRSKLLLQALDFGMTLLERNSAADQLVRQGMVAKNAMITTYEQSEYSNGYIQGGVDNAPHILLTFTSLADTPVAGTSTFVKTVAWPIWPVP